MTILELCVFGTNLCFIRLLKHAFSVISTCTNNTLFPFYREQYVFLYLQVSIKILFAPSFKFLCSWKDMLIAKAQLIQGKKTERYPINRVRKRERARGRERALEKEREIIESTSKQMVLLFVSSSTQLLSSCYLKLLFHYYVEIRTAKIYIINYEL